MCGRYASMRDTADLVLLTGAADETGEGVPSSERDRDGDRPDPVRSANVAPTDRVRVLVDDAGRRVLRRHVWGLIPPWSKDTAGAARRINARIETVAEKPSYRRAVRTARCVLPADGWYEWRVGPDGRRPHFVQRQDGRPLWLAGLWARWHPPAGGPAIASATVLTGPAPGQLNWLHERAPLLVPDALLGRWLEADGAEPDALLASLAGAGYPPLQWHEVSKAIGQVRDKGSHVMAPLGVAATEPPVPPAAPTVADPAQPVLF